MYNILRCKGRETLKLAEALIDLGGWTPKTLQRMRLPRVRKVVMVERPQLPSFVFIPVTFAEAAIALGRKRHIPECRMFIYSGQAPVVPEYQLLPLRLAEKLNPTTDEKGIPVGTRVEICAGPFREMLGVVSANDRRYVHLELEKGGLPIKLPSFMLRNYPL